MFTDLDRKLCRALCDHPKRHNNRYTEEARLDLLETLFRALTNDREDRFNALFPDGFSGSGTLQEVQEIKEGEEYSASARGHTCGHIFKPGEATYHCMTCTDDATAVLCSRCFDASDHEGHLFQINTSQGNNGCCDCGDVEAFKRPVHCAIHTAADEDMQQDSHVSHLPEDLQHSISVTVGRTLDYFCDVISCSPENLRLPKTEESVKHDEICSRLDEKWYSSGEEFEANPEHCLVLWNDEKHTVDGVQKQVARACRERMRFGLEKANEANEIGRSVIRHSRNIADLIKMCKVLEQIKVTVTIRSSRDTFREQMCGTIVEWLSDIAGCRMMDDLHILRQTVCQEMLKEWRIGSEAWNATIGKAGLDDHEGEEKELEEAEIRRQSRRLFNQVQIAQQIIDAEAFDDDDEQLGGGNEMEIGDEDDEDDDEDDDDEQDEPELEERFFHPSEELDQMQIDADSANEGLDPAEDGDEMDTDGDLLEMEASAPGQGPGPPEDRSRNAGGVVLTPTESETGDAMLQSRDTIGRGKTLKIPDPEATPAHELPPDHWRVVAARQSHEKGHRLGEDEVRQNMRLDSMILFDLRLWKETRIRLRDLFITTVVKIPQFKRVLGLRFARLYTTLSQLYLVADREPDHSIIHLSLQMLTTPSITEEVLEHGNFLTTLMAILYTFMTTRQVGFPKDVNPSATLAFDTGSVANRRLYHSFSDLQYILASSFVQRRVRQEKQYLLQFLDLAKLSQGICPNTRAVGEHVEYETDAWINASLLTKEMNKLCRQFTESYQEKGDKQISTSENTHEAIYHTACATIVNSVGLERKRFDQNEIKELIRFKTLRSFDFETNSERSPVSRQYRVIDFVVQDGALSFHHALHYTLSWLLEFGKGSRRSIDALTDAARRFIADANSSPIHSTFSVSDDALLTMFDYPLRVCAWLAQMKAGMWVRNGMSLRHQMVQYKSVLYRDVGHHRDLVLLQTALVSCDPSRVLATMIDRYGLDDWMRGSFISPVGREDAQSVDVVEEFIFSLVNLLSDRDSLLPLEDEPDPQLVAMRKEIVHILCFKPLSFSDLRTRLTEEGQQLQEVLGSMTNYRAPEGLHDSGMFELKPEYLGDLDPYNSNFSKNQRDEAEAIYRKWMAKNSGKAPEDIVLEPKLRPIRGGAYVQLAAVTRKPLFAQVIYYCLEYALEASVATPDIPTTRIEALLHVVLQLALIATLEDELDEDFPTQDGPDSFVHHALNLGPQNPRSDRTAIIIILQKISHMEEYDSCRAKIKHMLRLFVRKRETEFHQVTAHLKFPYGRLDTTSPANVESELEAKKKLSMIRKAKVMAQFQQQQQTFMENQGVMDWGDEDLSETETEIPSTNQSRVWKYPSGVCIHCREETSDSRLYGTFAMIIESGILRQTPLKDPDFGFEVVLAPSSLDQSMDKDRPFGVAGWNHEQVRRMNGSREEIIIDRQGMGKGWPLDMTMSGPVMTSCGHIMHFACFTNYYASVTRRQSLQISRNHPERTSQLEFVCPLCKAAGNAFLPIVWKSSEQSYPGSLHTEQSFQDFIELEFKKKAAACSTTAARAVKIGNIRDETLVEFLQGRSAPGLTRSEPNGGQTSFLERAQTEIGPNSELTNVYNRLRDTLGLVRPSKERFDHLDNFDTLSSSFAYSITATETGYRGIESDHGMTLLSKIPHQTLTHLKVISSTLTLYPAVRAMHSQSSNPTDYDHICQRLLGQIIPSTQGPAAQTFSGPLHLRELEKVNVQPRPLLNEDSFTFLVQASSALRPLLDIDVHHLLRLCYTAEMLRVLVVFSHNRAWGSSSLHGLSPTARECLEPSLQPSPAEYGAIESAFKWIMDEEAEWMRIHQGEQSRFGTTYYQREYMPTKEEIAVAHKLLKSYATAFLRKAAILFHVSYGVDFPPSAPSDVSLSELHRLSRLLKLSSIAEICTAFSEYSGENAIKRLASSWLQDAFEPCIDVFVGGNQDEANERQPFLKFPIQLLHPVPLELIGLPKHFDVLMDLAHSARCPTTGRDLTDPALCLLCGAIFCAQAFCCMTDAKRGGCNRHLRETQCAGGTIGLFLFIRKCTVLLLHVVPSGVSTGAGGRGVQYQSNGSWFHAPYLTKHGEHDQGLRMREQLILSQRRYDKLYRDAWLMVGGGTNVWSMVSRKLEGEVNHGGWETL